MIFTIKWRDREKGREIAMLLLEYLEKFGEHFPVNDYSEFNYKDENKRYVECKKILMDAISNRKNLEDK